MQGAGSDEGGDGDGKDDGDAARQALDQFHHQQIQVDEPVVGHGVHIVNQNNIEAAAGEGEDEGVGHGAHDILAHVHARAE